MRGAAQSRPGSLGAERRDAVGGDHAADRWLELLEVTQQGLEEQRRRSRRPAAAMSLRAVLLGLDQSFIC